MAVDTTAIAGLILAARTLSLLVEKQKSSREAEATRIILATGNEIADDVPGQRAEVTAAPIIGVPKHKILIPAGPANLTRIKIGGDKLCPPPPLPPPYGVSP